MLSFFVKRPIGTTMIYSAILLIGLISLSRLKVSLFPDIQIPRLTVLTGYPNVAPDEIENLVTRPVEDAVSSVNGVKKITSKSQEGLSIVDVVLDWGNSLDLATVNLRQKVDLAKSILPQDSEKPIIVKFDPSADPVITLVARGVSIPQEKIRDYIDRNVRPFLERIDGVASISIIGGVKREIQIQVDSQKLFAYGLSLEQIERALGSSNFNFPAGNVRRGDKEFTVRIQGEFQNVEEIGETVVASGQGGVVYLRQVARIEDGFRDRRGTALHNGETSVIVGIKKEPDKNTIETAKNIRAALIDINRKFERQIKFEVIQDRSGYISDAISNVRTEAMIGGLIAVIALFLFLKDIWPSLIIAITLPISIITTFMFMFMKGLSLNIMSLGGLALGIGMLLDSAIVVMESITLEREENPDKSTVETAISGARKVVGSVVSAAGTTIVVFVPIIFVPGIAGEVFRDFAFTITFSLLSSLICSLTLVPMLFALPIRSGTLPHRIFSWINRRSEFLFKRAQSFTDLATRAFDKSIDYSLKKPRVILGWSFGLGAFGLVMLFFLPKSLFPDVDQGVVQAEIELPGGSTIEDSEKIHSRIHEFLKKNGLSGHAVTSIGFDEDDLASRVKGVKKGNYSESFYYIDRSKMNSREFIETLSSGLTNFSNVKSNYRIKGEALQELLGDSTPTILIEVEHRRRDLSRDAAEKLRSRISGKPGIISVRSSATAQEPEIRIHLDREKVASYGLSIEAIARIIRGAVNGTVATEYRQGDQEIDVRLRLQNADRQNLDQIHRLLVPLGDEKQIELGKLIIPQQGLGYPTLLRDNQRRIEQVRVEFEKSTEKKTQALVEEIQAGVVSDFSKNAEDDRPTIRIRDENEETNESLKGLVAAFAISALLIYMLLAGQFESFVHPFTLALIIPLMMFGVSTALFVTGHSLNISSAIGIILLSGIVVDAATVLYEYIEQTRGENAHSGSDILELPEILKHCGKARIRAILLTGLTNMLGSLPSAGTSTSGDLQAPMAVTVIGGLAMSTVLTLIAFPTMFLVMERFRIRVRSEGVFQVIKSILPNTGNPGADPVEVPVN